MLRLFSHLKSTSVVMLRELSRYMLRSFRGVPRQQSSEARYKIAGNFSHKYLKIINVSKYLNWKINRDMKINQFPHSQHYVHSWISQTPVYKQPLSLDMFKNWFSFSHSAALYGSVFISDSTEMWKNFVEEWFIEKCELIVAQLLLVQSTYAI